MASVNIALICQIKSQINRRRLQYSASYKFKSEQKMLLVILTCFELSYLVQFAFDTHQARAVNDQRNLFD